MKVNEAIKLDIIIFCSNSGLRVAHAIDLYYKIKLSLGWSGDVAASEEIKNTIISMLEREDGIFRVSHEVLNKWVEAL